MSDTISSEDILAAVYTAKTNRRKIYKIPLTHLIAILLGCLTVKNVPDDLEILDVEYDRETGVVSLLVCSESFPPKFDGFQTEYVWFEVETV